MKDERGYMGTLPTNTLGRHSGITIWLVFCIFLRRASSPSSFLRRLWQAARRPGACYGTYYPQTNRRATQRRDRDGNGGGDRS